MEENKLIIYEIPKEIFEFWTLLVELCDESARFNLFLSKNKHISDKESNIINFSILMTAKALIAEKRELPDKEIKKEKNGEDK